MNNSDAYLWRELENTVKLFATELARNIYAAERSAEMSVIKCSSEYYVWNKNNAPLHKHSSIKDARAESQRLAKNNPGEEFFVVRVLESVVFSDNPFIYKHFHS